MVYAELSKDRAVRQFIVGKLISSSAYFDVGTPSGKRSRAATSLELAKTEAKARRKQTKESRRFWAHLFRSSSRGTGLTEASSKGAVLAAIQHPSNHKPRAPHTWPPQLGLCLLQLLQVRSLPTVLLFPDTLSQHLRVLSGIAWWASRGDLERGRSMEW